MKQESHIIYWDLSDNIKQNSLELMNYRADREVREIDKPADLKNVHGEAIKDYHEYNQILNTVFNFLGEEKGNLVAADLGSGTGVGASLFSKFNFVKKVFAIEYSEHFVEKIMPKTFELFDADISKIKRVVGDFNNIKMKNEELDLILEIGAFHHSENLAITMAESYRVLKKGGTLIAIERAHPDNVADEYLDELLEKEMSDHVKEKYGIKSGIRFTRKMWGEHEYRVGDWIRCFQDAGFKVKTFQFTKLRYLNLNILNRILNSIQRSLLFPQYTDKIYVFNKCSFKTCFIGIK